MSEFPAGSCPAPKSGSHREWYTLGWGIPRVPGGNRPLMSPASLLGYPRTVPSMNFADQGGLAPFLYFLTQDCLVWGPACRVGAEEGVAGLDLHYI